VLLEETVPRTLRAWLTGLAVGLCVLTVPSVSNAVLIVEDTVTPGVGVFHHEFTITNNTIDDVAVVSILDAPIGDPFIAGSLIVPVGFMGSYDSGLGVIVFLGGTQLFAAGTTTGGFGFDSAFARPQVLRASSPPSRRSRSTEVSSQATSRAPPSRCRSRCRSCCSS
jgi:hypothetical protein